MVESLLAVEILTWYLAWDLGPESFRALETQDGGWELVGVKLPALETLRRGKGRRPALLSTGSGCPALRAPGRSREGEFSGTSDLKPVCGKGRRPALLSTGSGHPAPSAFGSPCGRKITGTRDLTTGI